MLLSLVAARGAEEGSVARSAQHTIWTLKLDKAVEGDRALVLHLDVGGEKVAAAFGTTPAFTKSPHDVDAAALKLEGDRLHGQAQVILNPDPWVPRDHRPVACVLVIEAVRLVGAVSGSYKGACGAVQVAGEITGACGPRPAGDPPGRFRINFAQALRRLARAGGSNVDYALDMVLSFRLVQGKPRDALFETIVPDYRPYSALVEQLDLKLEGSALTGKATIAVDYGNDRLPQRPDRHVFTIHALAIGETVGGRFDAEVGEIKDPGRFLRGTIEQTPPPVPAQATAFIRLHGAMRNRAPVLLNLSLRSGENIHGHAYAPGFNHEVHTVDASGLRREGNVLKGAVKVSVGRDCYRPKDTCTLQYDIEAQIGDGVVAGKFRGNDDGQEFAGVLTGELRPQKEPLAMAALQRLELNLRYSLPSGPAPKSDWNARANQAHVIYHVKDGQVERCEVVNPFDAKAYTAQVEKSEFRIEGDRATGSCSFKITDSPSIRKGNYQFTFEGIVNGDQLGGYWRGSHDGEPILVKSAKLFGKLAP